MAKNTKNQHVVPHKKGWAVRREGSSRATSIHDTQSDAIKAAREIARNQCGELLIHGRNGQLRTRDSFGNDPYPPKEHSSVPRISDKVNERKSSEKQEIIEDQKLDREIRRDANSSGYSEDDALDIVRRYRMEKNNQRAAS